MKNKLHYLDISIFLQTQLYMVPFLLLFYQQYGLTVGDFFFLQGVFSLSTLFFEIPMGYLADIFPKRNILILSYIFYLFRLILWLCFVQYGYWILLIAEISFAAHKATWTGCADSYIYEYLKFNNIPQKMKNRYGKMNFFMALGTAFSSLIGTLFYTTISQYTLLKYNYNYGFLALICLELILNVVATGFLLKLPKIPTEPSPKITIKESYKKIFQRIVWIMKSKNTKYHILYSGLLSATTLVFVWSFQPIMRLLLLPIPLYGIVYFTNHLFRALGSLYSAKINHLISLSQLARLSSFLFIICFVSTFILLNILPVSTWISLLYFGFVSLAIGSQVVFSLLNTSRLHTIIPSDMRATSSSINMMVSRLYAGFFFILLKILLDGVSIKISFWVCFSVFLIILYFLKKFYFIQKQEERYAEN